MEGHEDMVTLEEIARMAHVQLNTARKWSTQPGFPEPLAEAEGWPVYPRGPVEDWLKETGKVGEPPTAF